MPICQKVIKDINIFTDVKQFGMEFFQHDLNACTFELLAIYISITIMIHIQAVRVLCQNPLSVSSDNRLYLKLLFLSKARDTFAHLRRWIIF